MKILNLGSLNIDRVYSVNGLAQPGQTISALDYKVFCGGKGLNQSVAIARAGARVLHAGMVGKDGEMLRRFLESTGADTKHVWNCEGDSGHAIIQVDSSGQNCIIVFNGANGMITEKHIDRALTDFSAGDILLTQNETSCVAYAIRAAHGKNMKVAFNPSPITPELLSYPLELVDIFILNETEGAGLSGFEGPHEGVLNALAKRFSGAEIVLTVGKDGAYYKNGSEVFFQPAFRVDAVDTTAAGDTFCGNFLALRAKGFELREALYYSTCASAISIGRCGAAPSIPLWEETAAYGNSRF